MMFVRFGSWTGTAQFAFSKDVQVDASRRKPTHFVRQTRLYMEWSEIEKFRCSVKRYEANPLLVRSTLQSPIIDHGLCSIVKFVRPDGDKAAHILFQTKKETSVIARPAYMGQVLSGMDSKAAFSVRYPSHAYFSGA